MQELGRLAHTRAVILGSVAVLLALALAFAVSPGQAHAVTKATKASASLQPKIVMIGDSYSVKSAKRNVLRPWPERVSASLGIAASNRTVFRYSGFGFAKPGKRFLQMLKGAKRDKTVTDVLIVGGAGNDRFCTKGQISAWYKKTIKRLRKLYPNATIMHTITSWDSKNLKYQRILKEHIPWYQNLAKKCGVTYLYGCETVMRTHYEYFDVDHRHPTEAGQRAISKKIVKKIRAYNPRYAKTASKSKSATVKKAATASAMLTAAA